MRNFLPKSIAILIGTVFLVVGGMTAHAQVPDVYIYQFKINSAPNTPLQTKQFQTLQECQASHDSAPPFGLTPCRGTTNAAVTQINQNIAKEQADLAAQAAARADNAIIDRLHCGIPITGFSENKVEDCIPVVLYKLVYKPASYLLAGSGYVFDAMLTLSIDSSFINQSFINSTWAVVRDFSNMLFIFILLFAGVQTILGIGHWQKTVLMVVVMALLINFSLFFTKVVIDAGNVLAVGIYSSMGTPKSISDQSFNVPGAVPERDISGSLAGAFRPQSFLKVAGDVTATDSTIVFIIASIVSIFAGYIIFKAAILFVRRLVVFWALMIISPFAFVSIALPGKANKFSEWLHELISQTFVVPVFLFFIYIIMKAISAGDGILGSLIKTSGGASNSFVFQKVLMPVMVAALVIKALQLALEFAEGMAGSTGASFSQLIGGAIGIAGGAAIGGVAGVGRKVIGGGAQKLLESDRLQNLAASQNKFARATGITTLAQGGVFAANKAKDATYDVRNIGGVVGKGIADLGVGKGGKLSYEKEQEAFVKEKKGEAKLFEMGAGTKEVTTVKEKSEKVKEIKETIKELKTVKEKADVELKAALTQDTTMRSSGSLDPKVMARLKEAKEKAAQAEEELKKATEAEKAAEKEEKTAKGVVDKENERRRGRFAKKAAFVHAPFSSEERKGLRAKIRASKTKEEKDEDDVAKMLKKLAEKLPKDEKKEESKH